MGAVEFRGGGGREEGAGRQKGGENIHGLPIA